VHLQALYPYIRTTHRLFQLAYFVFLLETVQTALTGADAYYWFMAGFGNMERLRNSNFAPIDSPFIDAVISLVVQVFFCYRIWTLSDRTLWLPLLIVVVRVLLLPSQTVAFIIDVLS
jgi:hypothetical protein